MSKTRTAERGSRLCGRPFLVMKVRDALRRRSRIEAAEHADALGAETLTEARRERSRRLADSGGDRARQWRDFLSVVLQRVQ